jgi:hypothetical protein
MANLGMTAGDYVQFQVNVTRSGAALDITGAQELTLTLQDYAGNVRAQWGIGTGVTITAPASGIATLTVTPAMTAFATSDLSLLYTWSFIDVNGFPTLRLEQGTFPIVLAP